MDIPAVLEKIRNNWRKPFGLILTLALAVGVFMLVRGVSTAELLFLAGILLVVTGTWFLTKQRFPKGDPRKVGIGIAICAEPDESAQRFAKDFVELGQLRANFE